MEKEFISYEQALALKELGFNEDCFGYYYEGVLVSAILFHNNKKDGEKVVKAPLYQQAFRWFREKHDLHGEISVDHRNKYFFMMCKFVNKKMVDVEDESEYYNTYEEAEKECLNKLIDIVHEK